jgi:O-acetyl-ADP-ribose deacetylase
MTNVLAEKSLKNGIALQIAQGDITTEQVDAIVNAANSQLQHGGGVAWAISRAGGPAIQKESDAWIREYGPVSHNRPAYTSGGKMPCRYVIHAVGPVWGDAQRTGASGNEDDKLAAAITGSLRVADELKLNSISFPAISTGIFGFPKERAARIIFKAIENYFASNPSSAINLVKLTLFDSPTVEAFIKVWNAMQ